MALARPSSTTPMNRAPSSRTEARGVRPHVLRDNGFAAGLSETRDAHCACIATPAADETAGSRPVRTSRALFCSRRSDWERFDDLFAAYWMNRGMKSAARSSETRPRKAAAEVATGHR